MKALFTVSMLVLVLLVPVQIKAQDTSSDDAYQWTGIVITEDGQPVSGLPVDYYFYSDEPRDLEQEYESHGENAPAERTRAEPDCFDADCTEWHYQDYYYQSGRIKTDSDGRYSIPLQGSGNLNINIHSSDYLSYHRNYQVPSQLEDTHTLVVVPPADAEIIIRVIDARGEPVLDALPNVRNVPYQQYACAQEEAPNAEKSSAPESSESTMVAEPYDYRYHQSCQLTMTEPGVYQGKVVPGYSIINVYHNYWQNCREACQQQYYHFSSSQVIADGDDITIQLKSVATPSLTLSGYLIDSATNEPVTEGIYINFQNLERNFWASAKIDEFGSYAVALQPGYYQISVWGNTYYEWQGMLEISKDTRYDIKLTENPYPQENYYGGCCIAYAEDGAVSPVAASSSGGTRLGSESYATNEPGNDSASYQDKGGLGQPYDGSFVQHGDTHSTTPVEPSQNIPSLGIVMISFALLGVGILLRRRV